LGTDGRHAPVSDEGFKVCDQEAHATADLDRREPTGLPELRTCLGVVHR
jgi:hypothetical protein